jgi:GH24 family phage-related lysozyme (muramidase)
MKLPKAGLDLIKRFEGCHLQAYPDPLSRGRPYTIGWGSTRKSNGSPFELGEKITQEEADNLLEQQLLTAYLPALAKIPHFISMSDEQVGALLSFAYNLGANFYGSEGFETISRRLRNKEWDLVPEALLLYRNPGSNVEAGLKRRRIAEGALWSKGSIKNKMVKTQIIALQNTLLKKEPIQSYQLSYNQKKKVQRGKGYNVTSIVDEGSHSKVILDYGAGVWYIYNPHWQVSYTGSTRPNQSTQGSRILTVKYFPQRDSATTHARRMCFSSSCAMAADYVKPNAIEVAEQEDDYYMRNYVFRHGDTTSSAAQLAALRDLGIRAAFRQNLNREDIKAMIDKNIPVPIGILHHGHVSAPRGGGHWVCVIGYNDNTEEYIVHDPYGELDLINGGYYGSTNGARMRYSYKNFDRRWMVNVNGAFAPGKGWGVIIEL